MNIFIFFRKRKSISSGFYSIFLQILTGKIRSKLTLGYWKNTKHGKDGTDLSLQLGLFLIFILPITFTMSFLLVWWCELTCQAHLLDSVVFFQAFPPPTRISSMCLGESWGLGEELKEHVDYFPWWRCHQAWDNLNEQSRKGDDIAKS